MRYSSALVLGTVVVGQAAAAGNRHASFHARRQAYANNIKRDVDAVDWSKVSYDLTNVDWSSVFNPSKATSTAAPGTPTPPATSTTPPAVKTSAAVVTPVASVPATSATPTPAPTSTSTSATTLSLGGLVSDLTVGVDSIISSLGLKGLGVNSLTNNGGIWIGDDSAWKAEFTNDASEHAVVFCWQSNGFSGMSLNVNLPAVSVGLKQGEKVVVSFAENVPSSCSVAYPSTKLALFGGIDNTWFEATFGSSGAFDISRNVNMNGNNISAKGSKCTSNMDTCVFKCQDASASSCETGYTLAAMDAPGCGGGYDTVMAGVGGGCSMGATGETVKVTLS
ncbi:hypothetical protein K504DRAFT_424894 [Pleomassaria siparia CBS 279.74]|uniref:Ubiquitin 3 binding protein But2 C-terminal domain-containing protein n=1 Tax=Pleomassaria siparia CBS 279.74 TaxID=1314801 RepID=A0A6G1KN25_9PLEO|nr:hypothetical protein K504DRAFT_424894 [Pleomassaria siparia CBS 279.74]